MMLDKIKAYVRKWNMLEKNDIVIAGVSGGADSICLLFVLLELAESIDFEIIAVHVNHGLRGEDALRDERYVQKICEKYSVKLEIFRENVELIARKRKQSTEEAGRDVRREAFFRTMNQMKGTKIALAHHQNDNAETFLLNLARGTGIHGIGGMRPVNGPVIRPLLCVERHEVEAYLEKKGITYCTDATNLEDEYVRNRVRNHVIPYMEQNLNDKTVQHMNQLMELMRQTAEYMDGETRKVYAEAVEELEGGTILIREQQLSEAPEVLQPMVLKKVLVMAAGRAKDIEAVHVEILARLMKKQCGSKADLPYRLKAVRCYDGIRIGPANGKENEVQEKIPEVIVTFDEEKGSTFVGDMQIKWAVFDNTPDCVIPCEKVYTKWFDYDIIKNGLTMRTRRPGDYITIDKNGNTQKLKSYFINEKIPREKRDNILLAAQGSHIRWIVGFRMGADCQISGHTKKVLEIRIDGGEKNGRDSKDINTGGRSK